jgi:hypothetical protein
VHLVVTLVKGGVRRYVTRVKDKTPRAPTLGFGVFLGVHRPPHVMLQLAVFGALAEDRH